METGFTRMDHFDSKKFGLVLVAQLVPPSISSVIPPAIASPLFCFLK